MDNRNRSEGSLSHRRDNPINRVKEIIRAVIADSTVPEDPLHAENTLDWLRRLHPIADDALTIAALGHDIERAREDRRIKKAGFTDFEAFKTAHALNSAEILRELLEDCAVPITIIAEVYHLVSRHEAGGDPGSDLLRDADSISFFDTNLPHYYKRNGRKKTLQRSIWGLLRLSEETRPIVERMIYDNQVLNNLLKEALHEVARIRASTR